jgi:hypothetical protein
MKLKTLLLLNERGMSMGYGSLTSDDTQLRPVPGGADDVPNWEGVTEGNGWFSHRGQNDYNEGVTYAEICITETGKPKKFKIKIKTRGLKKPNDTIKSFHERVHKHGDKITGKWISAAKKLHNEPKRINEVGNKIMRTWEECFKEALETIRPFITECNESTITGYEKSSTAIADPVNFTPRV